MKWRTTITIPSLLASSYHLVLESLVETKSTTLLNEAISNSQEVHKQLSIILQKLSNVEKKRKQLQTPRSNENHTSSNALAITFPKSIKVDFPGLKGEEHVAWIYKANQYFNYYKIPDHEKLPMTYFHMDGEALVWFKEVEDTELFISWDALVQALQVRLGSTASIKGYYSRTNCSFK